MILGCVDPGKEPSEAATEPVRVTCAFTGDLMFHDSVIRSAWDEPGSRHDFAPVFTDLRNIVDTVDIAVANFETVLAGEAYPYKGYPRFNTPDDILSAIKSCGFDILQTANNHCLDYHLRGLTRTIEKIREQGLLNCGTFAPDDSLRYTVTNIRGISVGFFAFTYGANGNRKSLPANIAYDPVNFQDTGSLEQEVRGAASTCDFLFILPHWGNEYEVRSSPEQRALARDLVKWGADAVIGTHPHVIQESERIGDVPVVYSLGNCVSSMTEKYTGTPSTQSGAVLVVSLVKGKETSIESIRHIPLWLCAFHDESKLNYEVVDISRALEQTPYRFSPAEREKMLQARKKTNNQLNGL